MKKTPLPELALAGLTLGWGYSFVLVPRGLVHAGVLTLTFLRMGLGLGCLLALRPGALRATRLEWRAGVLAGLLLAGGYVLQTAGLLTAAPGKSGFLTAFYVSLVPLVEAIVYRRWPPRRDLAALAVASAGIAVMVLKPDLTLSLGEGVVALSALCWAAQIVVVGRVAERVDPVRLAAIQIGVVAVVCGASSFLVAERRVEWCGELVWAVVFLGVVTNALGFLVQAWGQKRVPPTRTAILFSAEPVFAAAFGVMLAGERFGARDLAGSALVLAAVALTIWKPRPDVAPGEAGG